MTERARRLPRWIKVAALWIVLLEGGAWIADAFIDFRAPLLERLKSQPGSPEPIGERRPEWPDEQVRLRVADRGENRPHVLGGVTIEGAWPDAKFDLFTPDAVAERAAGRPRVFVLGGSAAAGFPYPYDATIAARLQDARPDLAVFNAGQIGWASGQVLGLAQRLLDRYEPAALVVYTGNNEFIAWSPFGSEAEPVWQRRLAHSRLLAAALYLGHRSAPTGSRVRDAPLFGYRHAIDHADDALRITTWRDQSRRMLQQYRAHLDAFAERAAAAGVQLVLLTVPYQPRLNPGFHRAQPLASSAATAGEVSTLLIEAADDLDAGDAESALGRADQALALDREPALLHYVRAIALEQLGRPSDEAFAESRERTVGNLGARLSVNTIVRAAAGAHRAALVDADRIARARREAGQPTIDDDCHPTPVLNAALAEALAEVVLPEDHGAEAGADEVPSRE